MRARAVGAALLLTAIAGAAQAKDPVAEGRYHLRKANNLAGDDRCRAAIHEYTLAYQKLKDPVVLFNRGECYRRIGEAEKALADYRGFLEAVPGAPNRAEIEAKIAALNSPAAPMATSAPVRPPVPHPSAPAPARPVAAAATPPVPVLEEPPPAAAPPPLVLAQPAAAPPSGADAHRADDSDHHDHHNHTWVWIALGAAVAGGAVGAYFALRPPATTPPVTDLGNYKF